MYLSLILAATQFWEKYKASQRMQHMINLSS